MHFVYCIYIILMIYLLQKEKRVDIEMREIIFKRKRYLGLRYINMN